MDNFEALFGWKLAIVAVGLLIFGYFYNQLVERLQSKTNSYTAELVVLGVLVTVLSAGFALSLNLNQIAGIIFFFICSGSPMVIGSIVRNMRDQEEARRQTRETLPHDD